MPLSIDEATRRYEGYVQNIQDSIYTIESYMGNTQGSEYSRTHYIMKDERHQRKQLICL